MPSGSLPSKYPTIASDRSTGERKYKNCKKRPDHGSWRTKEQGERAFLHANPESTIIRPSIIFGPGDSFFNVSPAPSSTNLGVCVLMRNSGLQHLPSGYLSYPSLAEESSDSSAPSLREGHRVRVLTIGD